MPDGDHASVSGMAVLALVVCAFVLVSAYGGETQPGDKDDGRNVKQELDNLLARMGKFYQASRVQGASGSEEAAQELGQDANAVRWAYRSMLYDALCKCQSLQVAFVLIDSLATFRLENDQMERLCTYLDKPDPVTDPARRAGFITETGRYPVYLALMEQGSRAVPVLQVFLQRTEVTTRALENACLLIFNIQGFDKTARWLADPACKVTGERKRRIIEIGLQWLQGQSRREDHQ